MHDMLTWNGLYMGLGLWILELVESTRAADDDEADDRDDVPEEEDEQDAGEMVILVELPAIMDDRDR